MSISNPISGTDSFNKLDKYTPAMIHTKENQKTSNICRDSKLRQAVREGSAGLSLNIEYVYHSSKEDEEERGALYAAVFLYTESI